mmetsp:Transcript_15608/g.30011  ORF Transcript_15608/g.30011 Transcript_15608/m.30011 type:complete len:271 (+) Transcript_15608:509-1321(+)
MNLPILICFILDLCFSPMKLPKNGILALNKVLWPCVQGWREVDSEAVLALHLCPKTPESGQGPSKCGFSPVLPTLLKKKVHALNPRFLDYMHDMPDFKDVHPTSGISMLFLLAHFCQAIDLYGFRHTGLKNWYFCKSRKFAKDPALHRFWLRNQTWDISRWTYADTRPSGAGPVVNGMLRSMPQQTRKGADPLYCGKGEARRSSTHQGFVHEVRKKKTKLSGKQAPSVLRKAHTDKVPKPGRRRLLYHAAGRELACMEEFHRMNLAVLKS